MPAAYAFVIHTTNPLNGNKDEIYCEVVRGLGEVLVGNYPGRALSFVANKNELWSPKARALAPMYQLDMPVQSMFLWQKMIITFCCFIITIHCIKDVNFIT